MGYEIYPVVLVLFSPFISVFPMSVLLFEQHLLNFSALQVWGFSSLISLIATLSCSNIKLHVLVQDFFWKGLLKILLVIG